MMGNQDLKPLWKQGNRQLRYQRGHQHPASLPCGEDSLCKSFFRNGLGPVKEGEAQYAVVHCTGYIKAWPPAGKQSRAADAFPRRHTPSALMVKTRESIVVFLCG